MPWEFSAGLRFRRFMLGISSNQYLSSAFDGLENIDIFGGLLKPLVFGTIIALVGCHCGLRTYGGTQGVGRSTTQAVVNASVLILIFDFLLSRTHPELHMTDGAVLEMKDVVKSYGDRRILDGVSFRVRRGETKIIIGASGSGKSTILKLVDGSREARRRPDLR